VARVGVTGAGFIGTALCRRLVADGHQVASLDVAPDGERRAADAGAEFRRCDITDPVQTRSALADRELVVNTAGIVREYGPREEFVAVNVDGVRNVIDAAEAAGADRVVHLASVAMWGWDFDEQFSEDEPPRPSGSPYFDTKGESELVARERGATVVRPGDVYGPGSIQWAVRPLEALRRRLLVLPARGEGIITPVYVDDLVDAVVRALTMPEGADRAFTVWDGRPVTTREFWMNYARMLGRDSVPRAPIGAVMPLAIVQEQVARLARRPPAVTPAALRYLSRRAPYPEPRRARELLGWEPKVSLEEGMRRTEEWFRAEGMLP
jgi:nucleoside-diphosphate-sugar epimerase